MKASLSNYRQSPRKVRLAGDLVKGKRVSDAIRELAHLPKRAGLPLKKLIESALANAQVKGENPENLIVKDVRVDKGFVFKRIDPRARGSAYLIRKRTSNIAVELGAGVDRTKGKKKEEKQAAATK